MIVRPTVDRAAAFGRLRAAAARDVLGFAPDVADLVGDYPVFDVLADDGRTVGAIAAGHHQFSDVGVIRCSAAACAPGHDMTAGLSAFLVDQARQAGAQLVTCETARRGLVRKLQAEGWTVGGFILRKKVSP